MFFFGTFFPTHNKQLSKQWDDHEPCGITKLLGICYLSFSIKRKKKKGSNFSKRITQSFVVETQSAALSWTKMGDCVTRMLLLLVLWHKVPVMHAEGIWLTLLCPASPLAKPLCACHVLVLQQTSKELWCALKASWGLIPSQGEACVPSWVGLAQSSLALTFTRGWEVRGFVEESK